VPNADIIKDGRAKGLFPFDSKRERKHGTALFIFKETDYSIF